MHFHLYKYNKENIVAKVLVTQLKVKEVAGFTSGSVRLGRAAAESICPIREVSGKNNAW